MKGVEDVQIKRAVHILKNVGHGYLFACGPDREASEAFVLAINALRARLGEPIETQAAYTEALEEVLRKALKDPYLPRSLKAEIRKTLSTTKEEGRE